MSSGIRTDKKYFLPILDRRRLRSSIKYLIISLLFLALSGCQGFTDESLPGSRTVTTLGGSSRSFRGLLAGVAADPAGNVFIAEREPHLIRKITPNGEIATLTGFSLPTGLASDSTGNVYVADTGSALIRKIAPNGFVSTVTANGDTRLNSPFGVTVDGSGNIFVADSGNHTIREILPDGSLMTLAGQSGAFGRDDGIGSSARFTTIIALDGAGALFVTDYGNGLVRKLQ